MKNRTATIRTLTPADLGKVTELGLLLWSGHTSEEMHSLFAALLQSPEDAVFLAFEQGEPIGFAQCGLRHDYVEGTRSSPVGYLEGIYVKEEHREQGIARRLLQSCEEWAKARGCGEFASDCELDNAESLSFHLKTGFSEANRIICLIKKL